MKFFKTKPDRKRNSLFRVRVENDRQGTADQILSRPWLRYAQNRPEESAIWVSIGVPSTEYKSLFSPKRLLFPAARIMAQIFFPEFRYIRDLFSDPAGIIWGRRPPDPNAIVWNLFLNYRPYC